MLEDRRFPFAELHTQLILHSILLRRFYRKSSKRSPSKTEKLTTSQKLRRVTHCKKLISLPRLTNMLRNVWFTDESWFFSDRKKNKAFYWALSKDAVKTTIFQKYPIKVHVWVAVSISGLIGPYFFHKDGSNITVNQYTYQDCIRWFICQLKLRNKFSKAIFIVHRIGILTKKKHGRKQFIAYICSLDDSEPIWTGSYFSNLWHFF